MKKIIIILTITLTTGAFYFFDVKDVLSFQNIKNHQQQLTLFSQQNPWLSLVYYFSGYALLTGLSFPGAAIITLLGGALFGLVKGTLVVSLASTSGACLSFLIARFLLFDWFQSKYNKQLKTFNMGIKKEGAFYLFTLRLIPLFPFFIINIVMGLTPIKLKKYFWASWLGMLPGTFIYVLAGTELAKIESPSGVLSPKILFTFFLIGVFPLIAKKTIAVFKKKLI